MNNYSILIVNEHMQYLFDEAAARRVQHVQKPALRTRIASAVSPGSSPGVVVFLRRPT